VRAPACAPSHVLLVLQFAVAVCSLARPQGTGEERCVQGPCPFRAAPRLHSTTASTPQSSLLSERRPTADTDTRAAKALPRRPSHQSHTTSLTHHLPQNLDRRTDHRCFTKPQERHCAALISIAACLPLSTAFVDSCRCRTSTHSGHRPDQSTPANFISSH